MNANPRFKFFVVLFFMSLMSVAAYCQDNIECDANLDLDNCGGCDYGYTYSGSCQDAGGGGGGVCPTSQGPYLTTYNDAEVDNNGNLEVWATTANSDGNYGEGVLSAYVSGTLPDGSALSPASNSSSYNSSVMASTSASNLSSNDTGQGQLSFQNQIQWACASSIANTNVFVGLRARTLQFTGYGMSDTGQYSCIYQLSCPAGQTATCTTNTAYRLPPCPEPWAKETSLVLIFGLSVQCFGFGNTTWSYTQGVCN